MDIQSETPDWVAVDRLLAAAAAYARTKGPTLVVNVGPVITVHAISHRGTFCGGAMAPGPRMMVVGLGQKAEAFERAVLSGKPSGFGRSATDAIWSGVFWGTAAIVEKLIAKVGDEALGSNQVLLTGHDGEWVGKELTMRHEYVPVLALEGLALAARRYGI